MSSKIIIILTISIFILQPSHAGTVLGAGRVSGTGNTAIGTDSVVAGGQQNDADGDTSVVGGGLLNDASGTLGTISGGQENIASGDASADGGGRRNTAATIGATIAGGSGNEADGFAATVGGGAGNAALQAQATVAGGGFNTAAQRYDTVGDGFFNVADGVPWPRWAAGRTTSPRTLPPRSRAGFSTRPTGSSVSPRGSTPVLCTTTGAWVWSDLSSFGSVPFRSTAPNQFLVNAQGGVGINTNTPTSTLTINGDIRVDDGTAAPGFILTALAPNGTAVWAPNTVEIAPNELIESVVLNGNNLEITEAGMLFSADLSPFLDENPTNELIERR